jgi:hypothetical protein
MFQHFFFNISSNFSSTFYKMFQHFWDQHFCNQYFLLPTFFRNVWFINYFLSKILKMLQHFLEMLKTNSIVLELSSPRWRRHTGSRRRPWHARVTAAIRAPASAPRSAAGRRRGSRSRVRPRAGVGGEFTPGCVHPPAVLRGEARRATVRSAGQRAAIDATAAALVVEEEGWGS